MSSKGGRNCQSTAPLDHLMISCFVQWKFVMALDHHRGFQHIPLYHHFPSGIWPRVWANTFFSGLINKSSWLQWCSKHGWIFALMVYKYYMNLICILPAYVTFILWKIIKKKKTLGSEEYQMVSWQLKSSGLWKTAISKNLLPLVIFPSRQTAAKASSSFCHSALLKTEWNFLYFYPDWHKGMVLFFQFPAITYILKMAALGKWYWHSQAVLNYSI